jgi:flagellar motor switch protein FliG
MALLDAEDRIAVLLHVLPDEVAQSALAQLSPDQAIEVRRRLLEIQQQTPPPEEVEEVLQDFECSLLLASSSPHLRVFRGADESAAKATTTARRDGAKTGRAPARPSAGHEAAAGDAGGAEDAATERPAFTASEDPIEDLNRLTGFQIAGALKDENPRTVAIVLGCLEPDKAAEILGHLPDALRSQAFVTLSRTEAAPSPLIHRIARTAVTKAATLPEAPEEQSDTDHKMAEMLRALPRKTRATIMDTLDSENPELSDRLKNLLYFFDDLLLVEDRSLQRLLMEVDAETLLTALRGADEAIVEKILRNVAKRVRETLTEEMQYMQPVPEERIEAARTTILRAMAQLDQQGQLSLEE